MGFKSIWLVVFVALALLGLSGELGWLSPTIGWAASSLLLLVLIGYVIVRIRRMWNIRMSDRAQHKEAAREGYCALHQEHQCCPRS